MPHALPTFIMSLEGKAVSVKAIKAYRGSSGIAPVILNLGARWK
jgi:hypothetical protein